MQNKKINSTWVVTLILWFFLWVFWIHRFFNWKIWTWILMLLTLWGLWIWWLIDWIVIVLGKFTDGENKFVKFYVTTEDNQ